MRKTILEIKRLSSTRYGTFGLMTLNYQPFCLTLEDVWLGNSSNVSCIPAGRYRCEQVFSPTFGKTVEVTGVPNRTHILFHAGNKAGIVGKVDGDTQGCILLGDRLGFSKHSGDCIGIADSRKAFEAFIKACADRSALELIVS